MKIKFHHVIILLLLTESTNAQQYYLPIPIVKDSAKLADYIPVLAKEVLTDYKGDNDPDTYLNNLFRLQMLAGDYTAAIRTIDSLRTLAKATAPQYSNLLYIQYELYARTKLKLTSSRSFNDEYSPLFTSLFNGLDDRASLYISTAFLTRNGIEDLQNTLQRSFVNKDSLNLDQAIALLKNYHLWQVYKNIEPISKQLLKADDNRRYIIEDSVLIRTKDGATLSAVVVRKRNVNSRLPATLFFTIYTDLQRSLYEGKQAAVRGYVGVVGDTRGKRLSPDSIEPYEHEAKDVNAVIDWISKQPWCNGKVGMYGGSYCGFVQWAATKYLHPALKTIVPYVAAIPGQGLPMENNVFLNANYQWAFYVTDNKYLDNAVNDDWQRWEKMRNTWYASGIAYRKIDSIDGEPNIWLQKWLKHPAYDQYWQSMVPYKEEYAKINIPVLTFEGYYDDGQISGLQYYKDHLKYNKKANHYLIIGPYDHFGTQSGGVPELRGYTVDPVALINTRDITFQWMDYIFKSGPKPSILKDKINYELMGANVWRHVPSLTQMNNDTLILFLSNNKIDSNYQLVDKKPIKPGYIDQVVDLADRTTDNSDYYPYPIIKKELDRSNSLFFISKPFDHPVSVNGSFFGELKPIINKKDMDVTIVLYEVTPKGEYFHLAYFIGRASYAEDIGVRKLLHPGKLESITFNRVRMACRQMSKGSRLLVVLSINKNSFAQINYGTGKDVSDETIDDAKVPLKIKWSNGSYIKIPVGTKIWGD
jgi:hypothetical protein